MNKLIIKFNKGSYEEGIARRTDSNLRAHYFSLETTIYKINASDYQIQLHNMLENYNVIKTEFDNRIKQFCMNISLVKDMPKNFEKILKPLEITENTIEGIFLNEDDLKSLIENRFDIKILKYNARHSDIENVLEIDVNGEKSSDVAEKIKNFVIDLGVGFKDVIVKYEYCKNTKTSIERCLLNDNDFWFDNSKKIFSNEITLFDSHYFVKDASKCYVDYTIYKHTYLDIRSLILLFDKVYLSLPSKDNMNIFYMEQGLTREDLIELVERNKIVIVLTTYIDFYDKSLLNELAKNDNSIITLRGLNNIFAMFFTEIYYKWRKKWENSETQLIELQKEILITDNSILKSFYKYLMYPYFQYNTMQNYLNCPHPTNIMCLSIDDIIDENRKSDICLFSSPIHIAAMLEALYFPCEIDNKNQTDAPLSNLLYSLLNYHMYPFDYERNDINNFTYFCNDEYNPIQILRCDKGIKIQNYIDYSEKYKTTNKLFNVIKYISCNSIKNANCVIDEINNDIASFKLKGSSMIEYILKGAGVVTDIGIFPTIMSILLKFPKVLDMYNEISINHRLQNNIIIEKDVVSYMSKLQAVVSLKNYKQ